MPLKTHTVSSVVNTRCCKGILCLHMERRRQVLQDKVLEGRNLHEVLESLGNCIFVEATAPSITKTKLFTLRSNSCKETGSCQATQNNDVKAAVCVICLNYHRGLLQSFLVERNSLDEADFTTPQKGTKMQRLSPFCFLPRVHVQFSQCPCSVTWNTLINARRRAHTPS